MSYIGWAVVAMFGYGVTAVLLKVALRYFPPEVTLVITNTVLVAVGLVLVVVRGEGFAQYVSLTRPTLIVALAGLTLSLSIASYYVALSRGPASSVVPIFAMNFAVASLLAILVLGEEIKPTRMAGMAMAAGAVVLLTR